MRKPFAEDVNYWKTGRSSPDIWLDKAIKQIESVGGRVLSEAFGRDGDGSAAFMLRFKIGNDVFKIIWPVLPTRTDNIGAAKRQAATMLYHDIKARCVSAIVIGTRASFFNYLELPDGRTASDASASELMIGIPSLFGHTQQLVAGEIIDERHPGGGR